MDLEPVPPSGDSLKCCSCSCCLSWDEGKSLKRKFDQINRSCLVAGSDNGESSSVARVEIENECAALREALSSQQQSMQRLCGDLEEERSASASAANEAMSMILRLQREKAEIQMEARQYKRYADEKMAHDQQELLEMEDMLYRKDQIIYSLSYEVEAYKHRIMSLGYTEAEAEGMIVDAGVDGHISSQIMGGIGNNHETPFDYPLFDYPPLKCERKETHVLQDPGIDEPLDLDKYAFGETPHQEQFQNVECEIHQLERNPSSNQIDGDYFTTKNFVEKATVGQSPRWPRHARRFSTESSSSLLGIAKETGQEDYSFLKKVDNASDVGDDMSDRVYTVDSVQGVPYNGEAKINIGICNDYLTAPRESLARFDMGETDIKKLYIRLQALEADRESLRQEILSMRTNKAQLMLMKEMSQLLCKKLSPEKRVVVKKRSLFGGFSFPSLLKQKFTLKDEPHIKEAVYQQLNRQYRDYRHRLHKDYYCKYDTDEMRLENPPSCVSTDDWVDLVRYFGSEDFKKMSNRNKENRQKKKIGHVAGTKAFARISYDSRNLETGDEPSRTSLWFTTRYSMKKRVWADSTSQKVYDELKRLESQPPEEGTPPMTEDQRFEVVLGPERSGYIRCRGAGPKPKTSTVGQRIHAQLERENEEFRRRAEADTRRLELLEKENSEMASRMESLESQLASQQTQVQAQV